MAYFLQNGDTVQSAIVTKTLNAKTYIIPGVTCSNEVEMPSAETLLYWTTAASAPNTVSTPGSAQTFTAKALVKKSITVTKAAQLNGVIPGINIDTVQADQVNSYVVKDTLKAANGINEDFISVVEAGATAATTASYSAADVYGSLLDLAAEFTDLNKAVGMKPTACFVDPVTYAKLLKNNLIYFKDNAPVSVFPFTVIECPDLTSGTHAVMLNAVKVASGIAFTDVATFDARPLGYAKGVGYIGEIAYVNALLDMPVDDAAPKILSF